MASIAATVKRVALSLALFGFASPASAGPLDEMPLARWAKLREAERYQLNVAEKFYREKQYKVAADEYEKFLKLYETSEGASYAQMMWSHCQVHGRKQNTAIKDGYQSVIDYFPESPEAPLAAFLIGRTYKEMGDLPAAKKAYTKAVSTYPKHFATVLARFDLVEIATKDKDEATRVSLLRELTYDVERKGSTADECRRAAWLLTQHYFRAGDFAEGMKALTTTCKEDDLPTYLMRGDLGRLPESISELTGSQDMAVKQRGEKLADAAAGWLQEQVTADLKDEKRKPRAIQCWNAIADVRQAARQPDKQKAVYEQMLAALGADDTILGRLAQWYKAQNQWEQARATFAKYKDANEGQGQIAYSFLEQQKFDEATAIYRKLAVQDDKNVSKWLGSAAYTQRRAGKADQAIAIYRELLTADAAKANDWHWEIAQTLYDFGRWKEAITAYRGTDRFPTNYQHMAMANRRLKQFDEAIALYQQILVGHPATASWALIQIGYTHEEAGRSEAAIKSFKQVCDRFPKSPQGSEAHSHLNTKYKITVTLGGAKD